MGSFFGHALPGSFFIFFAVWWTVQAFRRYYRSLTKTGPPFISTATYTVTIRGKPRDVEAIAVTVMTSLGIFVELVLASIKDGHFVGVTNYQHSTMYFYFGMVGVLALVLPRVRLFPDPQDVLYVFLALAFGVEALLFKFHLYGRDTLDVMLHTLLLYSVYGSVLCTLVEMRYRGALLPVLGRAACTLLQGTWFWQTGFILYNPLTHPWGRDHHDDGNHDDNHHDNHPDHEYNMLITCAFIWHAAAVILLMTVTGGIISCWYRRGISGGIRDYEMQGKGYRVLNPEEDGVDS